MGFDELHLEKGNTSIDAEQAVIGLLLTQNHFYDLVADYLTKDDFQDPVNVKVYEAIQSIIAGGETATYISVMPFFSDYPFKDKVYDYLKKLSLDAWPSTTLSTHVKEVLKNSKKSRISFLFNDTIKSLNNTKDIEQVISDFESEYQKIIEKNNKKSSISICEGTASLFSHVKNIKKGGEKTYIPTKLTGLDKIIGGGINKTDLIILAGRTSMGKTALALNLALNMCKDRKKHVAFFSLEMSNDQIACRILSCFSEVPSHLIRNGNFNNTQEKSIEKACLKVKKYSLTIDDTPALSLTLLVSRARRMKRTGSIDCIVVDYLQLVQTDGKTKTFGRVIEVGTITGRLKALAKELSIPIILLSQLSRATESKDRSAHGNRPQLSDLRESGSIEQDADIVMFIYRKEYYIEMQQPEEGTKDYEKWEEKKANCAGVAEVIVGKNRHGKTGKAMFHFDKERMLFRDYEREKI